ncbi:phosphatase YwpJ [Salinibacillus aidingensis]|uniref:Phosphatase YwpJ n=1 Tax=Salinibacillus aidingensis TaxID=237684 RepID=A0ABP3KTI7_9BACI
MGIIAIDMDGTLINSHHQISKENIAAIKKALKLGHEVVIATGRAQFDVKKILDDIDLSLYTIGANGATIHSPAGTNILSESMPEAQTRRIADWLNQQNFYYEMFCESGIYTPVQGREILKSELKELEIHSSKIEMESMEQAYEKQVGQTGYVFMESNEKVYQDKQKVYNILAFSFLDKKRINGWNHFAGEKDVTLVSSSPYNFELEHPRASKGNALKYLAQVLNMSLDNSIAIGDSGNDISMFKAVSHSYAMENAKDYVKKEADYIAISNDQNGVARVIHSFLDNE